MREGQGHCKPMNVKSEFVAPGNSVLMRIEKHLWMI